MLRIPTCSKNKTLFPSFQSYSKDEATISFLLHFAPRVPWGTSLYT